MNLYIIRHGETEENAAGILQGHLEGHLTEKGKQQTREVRDLLATQICPDLIIASDLRRTIDTAQILNEAFHCPLETSSLLRERDWGEYTGKAIVTIPKGRFPDSVETLEQMDERAYAFLAQLLEKGRQNPALSTLLIVSHGVFSRCLLAAASHKSIHEIPLFKNLEVRQVELPLSFVADRKVASPADAADNASILSHGKEC